MPLLFFFALMAFGDLARPEALVWYDDLLARGGYGRLPRECAAFLIRESDGSLTLAPWPETAHHRATFRGRVPDGAIAILHTHPREQPNPSPHDRQEARRLRMPVLVITPRAVIAAMPGGEIATILFLPRDGGETPPSQPPGRRRSTG